MQYTRTFANLCNAGVSPAHLGVSAEAVCSPNTNCLANVHTLAVQAS
jgi:hypothetical protein